jgi:hypothetical protein
MNRCAVGVAVVALVLLAACTSGSGHPSSPKATATTPAGGASAAAGAVAAEIACERSITWIVSEVRGGSTHHPLGPRLIVPLGHQLTLTSAPKCELNLRADPRPSGLLKVTAGSPSPTFTAVAQGVVVVVVTVLHGMCDGRKTIPVCIGGLAMDGQQVIDVSGAFA